MNAGSSSLKFGVFWRVNENSIELKKVLKGQISQILSDNPIFTLKNESGIVVKNILQKDPNNDPYKFAVEYIMQQISAHDEKLHIVNTVHRVVHGGDEFKQITQLTPEILKQLERYIALAALHQPYNLKIANFFCQKYQDIKHYACFDTAFHQTIDEVARVYAIPDSYAKEGIKRYGFHGLSYQYITNKLVEHVGEELARKKWIIAHLGSGASLCAVRDKKSVATSLGFSVLEGLPMATRCGELDPGIIIYLNQQKGLSIKEIDYLLYNQSGLLGLSGGLSSDVKTLLELNKQQSDFAIDVFCYNVLTGIGKMAAALGGCDGLIFTAGIGENAAKIRQKICAKLGWLNIKINGDLNERNQLLISAEGIPVMVIPTDEEYIMAQESVKISIDR
jgi:acetate kinase